MKISTYNTDKIAIGTAQFGLNYGISNTLGQTKVEDAIAIISTAKKNKIDTIDTAMAYGSSEETLGNCPTSNLKIVTKLPEIPSHLSNKEIREWILKKTKISLSKLKKDSTYAILLHRPEQLKTEIGSTIYNVLDEIKQNGLTRKIGISTYNPTEIISISNYYKIDIAQTPFNIIDQRLINDNILKKIKDIGIEVHVRSIFLQGLLLLENNKHPKEFSKWKDIFITLQEINNEKKYSPIEACLNFVIKEDLIDKIVVGINSLSQINQILDTNIINNLPKYDQVSCQDETLINPALWSRK